MHISKEYFLKSSSFFPLYVTLIACLGAGQAWAQSSANSDPTMGVEDIVVTAQKRSQSVQDVPATIAAFSQEALENRQVRDLGDLTSRVPSLQVGYTFGSNTITLRGISTNLTSGFEDPSVAVHVNGVYQARARSLNLALMDLERVEVLSGPQGTLYGRNATGGVINYILRSPTSTTQAEITGSAGNYDSYGIRGFISGPINDKVGFRIAGLWDNRDKGFTKNVLVGAPKSRFEENHVVSLRGVIAIEPTDTLHVDLEGSFSHTRGSFQSTALAPALNPVLRARFGSQPYRPHEVASDFPSSNDTKDYGASATVNWDISGDVQFKSISAYQRYDNHFNVDQDFSSVVAQHLFVTNKSDTFTEELNLNTSTFGGRLKSVFGLFYFDDKAFQHLDGFFSAAPAPGFVANNRLRARSIALFTDHTFSVTDRLRLIGGIRFNSDKKTTFNSIGSACPANITRQKWTAWTPRAGVQYDVTNKIMLYATYQKGFKAGGVSTGTCGDDYEPEHIKGGEAGIKTEFADGQVRLNLAAYWYNYSNLQVQQTLPALASFQVLNAADARIKGIEGNLNVVITDGLRFDAAAMVQTAKYTNFVNCDQTAFVGACGATDPRSLNDPTRFEQLSGNWLNRAPPYSVNLGLEYKFDTGPGELMLRGESFWSGKVRFNEFNTPIMNQNAYNIQNAFATFTPANGHFVLRAFIKNIGDVRHKSASIYNGGVSTFATTWAPPRTYGGEVTFKF